jgi:hypothetical protein
LPKHSVSLPFGYRLRAESDGPIALTRGNGVVRRHRVLMRQSLLAGPEHDGGETEACSNGVIRATSAANHYPAYHELVGEGGAP